MIHTFEGSVTRVDRAEAVVVLRHSSGREGTALLPVEQLAARGIHVGDDFTLMIKGEGSEFVMTLTLTPRRELTQEEIDHIRAKAAELSEMLAVKEAP